MTVARGETQRKSQPSRKKLTTREKLDFIIAWNSGRLAKLIAHDRGVTTSAVTVMAKRMGLTPRRPPMSDSDAAYLTEKWQAGMSIRAMARECGMTPQGVSARIKRLGLPARKPKEASKRRTYRKGASNDR